MKLGLIYNLENAKAVEECRYPCQSFKVALAYRMIDDPGLKYTNSFEVARKNGGTIIFNPFIMNNDYLLAEKAIPLMRMLDPDRVILPQNSLRYEDPFLLNTMPHQRVYVPFGTTVEDAYENLRRDLQRFTCRTIGLPAFNAYGVSRLELLERIASSQDFDPDLYAIWLLGIESKAKTEPITALKVYPHIEAIITSAPIAYAQNEAGMIDQATDYKLKWSDRANFHRVQRNVSDYTRFLIKASRTARKGVINGI